MGEKYSQQLSKLIIKFGRKILHIKHLIICGVLGTYFLFRIQLAKQKIFSLRLLSSRVPLIVSLFRWQQSDPYFCLWLFNPYSIFTISLVARSWCEFCFLYMRNIFSFKKTITVFLSGSHFKNLKWRRLGQFVYNRNPGNILFNISWTVKRYCLVDSLDSSPAFNLENNMYGREIYSTAVKNQS